MSARNSDVRRPIVVTGASGQLGQTIVQAFGRHVRVVGFSRGQLDVTQPADVLAAIVPLQPSAIVNCAAFNAVDRAEDEPEEAFRVNALAVLNLARCAHQCEAALVHYGTDFVFDGESTRPYGEEDRPEPRSTYAASKLMGEWLAADAPNAYVLRVESLFGGVYKHGSSVDRIVQALLAGKTAPVFVDRVVSPSYAYDVADATWRLLSERAPAGLYHVVNTGHCTWHELGEEIARLLGVPARLQPVRLNDLTLRATRPRFCALSNAKLARLGIEMPTWQSALQRHLSTITRDSTNEGSIVP